MEQNYQSAQQCTHQFAKKALSLFLSVVMLLSITAGLDLTAYAETSGNYEYTVLDDGTAEVTKYTGSAIELSIPSTLNGYTVTRIGVEAFYYCESITSIIIPNSVTSIGDGAFEFCTNLTSITIPNSVTSIGDSAFSSCDILTSITIPNSVTSMGNGAFANCYSLASITIPNSVTSIGESAFYGCKSLTSITIPDSVTSIGDWAFSDCNSLTSIAISGSVTSIGDNAFYVCKSLTSINVDSKNKDYSSENGVLFNKSKTELIRYPEGKLNSSYTIPGSVTSIGNRAFKWCTSLISITIPDSVTSIGDWAFSETAYYNDEKNWDNGVLYINNAIVDVNDNLFDSFIIKNGTTAIADHAFSYCNRLKSVTIPNSVISIGRGVFYHCISLISITIPDSVTSIGDGAFADCDILNDIYYSGTKEQWNNINIEDGNSTLENANIYYNWHNHNYKTYTTKATISKNGSIVKKCSECGAVKSTTTIYYPKTIKLSATSYNYDGKVKKPSVTVKDSKGKSISASNYTVTYQSGRKSAGKYAVKITFKGNYSGSKTLYFTIKPYYPKTVKLSATSYTYNGKTQKPSVVVKDSKGRKISSSYYTVTYQSGRKNVGKYAVKVTFKGNYSGSKMLYFTIKPKSTSISKLTAGSKKFTAYWKKQTSQTTGYQIQYSTSSKFKSAKTVTVGNNKTTAKTVSKLSAKKKYYVRVRTYKTVKINGKATHIFSSWSKAKAVTTKR